MKELDTLFVVGVSGAKENKSRQKKPTMKGVSLKNQICYSERQQQMRHIKKTLKRNVNIFNIPCMNSIESTCEYDI